jgi:hypothetical protein
VSPSLLEPLPHPSLIRCSLRENIKGHGRSPVAFKKHKTIIKLLYNEPAIKLLLPKGQDFIIKTCVLIYVLFPTSKSLLGIPAFCYFIGEENGKNNIKRLINIIRKYLIIGKE